jgi:hypothetical protein
VDDLATTVTIAATDDDGGSSSVSFDLTVNNVAPDAQDDLFEVVENSASGTLVGAVSATDPAGANDPLSFSIIGGTGATAFAIDSSTGEITVADPLELDYETSHSFTLLVEVADGDGGSDTATITIDLVNQASISGVVFVDVNQNQAYDANEPGVDGVTIELLDENGVPVLDALGAAITAVTNNGGFYLLAGRLPDSRTATLRRRRRRGTAGVARGRDSRQ